MTHRNLKKKKSMVGEAGEQQGRGICGLCEVSSILEDGNRALHAKWSKLNHLTVSCMYGSVHPGNV